MQIQALQTVTEVVGPELQCTFCNIPNAEKISLFNVDIFLKRSLQQLNAVSYKQHNMKIQHH